MNRTLIGDFYEKVENLLTQLDIKDKQVHLWNWDEAGLMYAMKYDKTMCQLGRKQWRTEGGFGGLNPSKIPKALQNRARLNPIVKTVKNC